MRSHAATNHCLDRDELGAMALPVTEGQIGEKRLEQHVLTVRGRECLSESFMGPNQRHAARAVTSAGLHHKGKMDIPG